MIFAQCNTCGTQWGLYFVSLQGKEEVIVNVPDMFSHLLFGEGETTFCNEECRNKYSYSLRIHTRGTINAQFRKNNQLDQIPSSDEEKRKTQS